MTGQVTEVYQHTEHTAMLHVTGYGTHKAQYGSGEFRIAVVHLSYSIEPREENWSLWRVTLAGPKQLKNGGDARTDVRYAYYGDRELATLPDDIIALAKDYHPQYELVRKS